MLLDVSDSLETKTVTIKTVKHPQGLQLTFKPLSARSFLRFQSNMLDNQNKITEKTISIIEDSLKESCTDTAAWSDFVSEVKNAGFTYIQTLENIFQFISPVKVK